MEQEVMPLNKARRKYEVVHKNARSKHRAN